MQSRSYYFNCINLTKEDKPINKKRMGQEQLISDKKSELHIFCLLWQIIQSGHVSCVKSSLLLLRKRVLLLLFLFSISSLRVFSTSPHPFCFASWSCPWSSCTSQMQLSRRRFDQANFDLKCSVNLSNQVLLIKSMMENLRIKQKSCMAWQGTCIRALGRCSNRHRGGNVAPKLATSSCNECSLRGLVTCSLRNVGWAALVPCTSRSCRVDDPSWRPCREVQLSGIRPCIYVLRLPSPRTAADTPSAHSSCGSFPYATEEDKSISLRCHTAENACRLVKVWQNNYN